MQKSKKVCQICRDCCWFKKEDRYFAPIFTADEVIKIKKAGGNGGFFKPYKKFKNIFQIKLIKSRTPAAYFVCPFLKEKTHLCAIYHDRPLDCKIWPLVITIDPKRKNKLILTCFEKQYCAITATMSKKEYATYIKKLLKLTKKEKIQEILKKFPNLSWKLEPETSFIKKLD